MLDIDKELSEIRECYRLPMELACQNFEIDYYKNLYPDLKIEFLSKKNFIVNDYKINYTVDQYNNPYFEWENLPPVEYLDIFAHFILRSEIARKHFYQYRTLIGFFIQYVQDNFKDLSAVDLFNLLKISRKYPVEGNNRKKSGLEAWLGGGYGSRCVFDGELRTWKYKNEFFKLLNEERKNNGS